MCLSKQSEKMKILIIGDSMIKYLQEYLSANLPDYEVDFRCFPGARIERLTREIAFMNNHFHLVFVHVGTNNSNDDLDEIHRKYGCLYKGIERLNPKVILFSGVLPRCPDLYRDCNTYHLQELNRKILNINSRFLATYEGKDGFFFCSSFDYSWSTCLSRDGLHLNRRGNQQLGKIFVKDIRISLTVAELHGS
ncbi:uncharacterized protein LOC118202467 [Stegodyphus dumicola]|uniref:uncharacterized protein LOC118180478 n=1 Tax=Stegodyphus dumicola TaxID=202533 RepID=UPI0015AD150F|nr:uncharacterized protein LOC118180478 [Stegodyphus dumicola]XP_035230538.1 uncharacterized protein LOC118202467 [Stegodyphus dumicola]